MKANEFVKKVGWDGAKRVIELTIRNSWADHYNIEDDSIGTAGTVYSKKLCEHNDNFVCLRSLKRLVESYELVMEFGDDTSYLKEHLLRNPTIKEFYLDSWCRTFSVVRLKQAIADVEACNA